MKRRFGLDPLTVLELMNVGRDPTKRAAGAITFWVISSSGDKRSRGTAEDDWRFVLCPDQLSVRPPSFAQRMTIRHLEDDTDFFIN